MRGKKVKGNTPIGKRKMGRPKKARTDAPTPYSPPDKFGTGSIVKRFDATPEPKNLGDIICPHFYELKYANGCNFDCQWCYLNGTFRFQPGGKTPKLKDRTMMLKDLEDALEALPPTVFNAGELSDALVFESAIINDIVPLFMKYKDKGHKLLLLTKSDSTRAIAACRNAKDLIIFAYSINARVVADKWEVNAPSPRRRLQAAKTASEYGYEVRFRLDPMVPVEHWEDGYREIIKEIVDAVPTATIITLGSLRGLQSTILFGKKRGNDMSWIEYLREDSRWGKRPLHKTRLELYKFAIDELRKQGFKGYIGICKETALIFRDLEINPLNQYCNCGSLYPFVSGLDEKWEKICKSSIDATPAEEEYCGEEAQQE